MQRLGEWIVVVAGTCALTAVLGCGAKDGGDPAAPSSAGSAGSASTGPAATSEPAVDPGAEPAPSAADGVVLVGTIIKKPWSKSTESWNAGGSEYYVLDVGGAAVEHKSAAEGVTLIATDAAPMATLESKVGQKVTVRGEYVAAKPYKPESPMEQYPTGMDGKPLPRGAGFRVLGFE